MDRAYSAVEFKAVDDDKRVIEGIASTLATDRDGDIVEPLGAKFKLPLPMLWQHRASEPIGLIDVAKATKDGITIRATVAPAGVSPEIDKAWALIKAGLVRGLSIGFKALEAANIEGSQWGRRFLKWELFEVSAVTIPANAEASITSIKSIDAELLRAASGTSAATPAESLKSSPGASGKPATPLPRGKPMAKTYKEQIADFEAKRAADDARRKELMTKAADEGRTLDETEEKEYDGLDTEIKRVDAHLVRLRMLEEENARQAKAVDTTPSLDPQRDPADSHRSYITVQPNVEKGTAFTRYVQALGIAHGNRWEAAQFASAQKHWRDTTPIVENVLKAAVAAGTTTDTTWAAPLVDYQTMAGEFIELLRPATILGRIPGLRRVPFNIRMASQTAGSTMYWVGEGQPKPVSKLAFNEVTLRWSKAAGIVVLTEELVRASNPNAEAVVRQDMIDQMAQFLDGQFIHPGVGEVTNVSPGSITAGIAPITPSGATAAAFRADFQSLLSTFITNNLGAAGLVWVMSETAASNLSLMMNALDQSEFPTITPNGGTLLGYPVITSQTASIAGSPTYGNIIILMKPSEILVADEGQVMIDASREASLQMLDNPTNSSTGATAPTTVVSMFQTNSVAIRAERWINWKRRRDSAVAWINNSAYTG